MAYDQRRERMVLFGGFGNGSLDDTWEWDGTTWTQRFPVAKPTARSRHAMAYDTARGTIVLFGGGDTLTEFDETWEYPRDRAPTAARMDVTVMA